MVTFDAFILTIIWGFLIGILVSAPMGPTGILVIQRTLNRGGLIGFFTGLGASLSDFIYALISTFALSFVVDWIEQYRATLQFTGSFFIALYAIYLWHNKPDPTALDGKDTKGKSADSIKHSPTMLITTFLSGFAVTIANPFIIFFYLILFARTNFLFEASAQLWWLYVVGFGCLVGGAICWWLLITWAVNKVRNHFRVRTLRNINRGIAAIMFLIALFGCGNGIYYLLK